MAILTRPRLTAQGIALNTSAEAFGELRRSGHLLGDSDALRERMQEDRYLYLPGLLDREEILDARRMLTERLAAESNSAA